MEDRRQALTGRERLVFPLDGADARQAREWIRKLAPHVGVFKVGLELFVEAGPDAIAWVHDAGNACFLDLKLHDIPATMRGATARIARHRPEFLTIHATAGREAVCEVVAACEATKILAVTVLTSMNASDAGSIGISNIDAHVERLGSVAVQAGAHGLVASPHETHRLRQLFPTAILMIPGIRPAGADTQDQSRTASPAQAIASGADYLVVGRPIRMAADPAQAAQDIAVEIDTQLASLQGRT